MPYRSSNSSCDQGLKVYQKQFLDQLVQDSRNNTPWLLSELMETLLYDSARGYYTTSRNRPLTGDSGDFITAPTLTPLFGETLALWAFAQINQAVQQYPEIELSLLELGPGDGSLLAALLPLLLKAGQAQIPKWEQLKGGKRLKVYLLECSPLMQAQQEKVWAPFDAQVDFQWFNSLTALQDALNCDKKQGVIVLANEFLDCMPVDRMLRLAEQVWQPWVVYSEEHRKLDVQPAPKHVKSSLRLPQGFEWPQWTQQVPIGKSVEISAKRWSFLKEFTAALSSVFWVRGLWIDYGYAKGELDWTVQALFAHQRVSLFENPFESDVTAHVDFLALQEDLERLGWSQDSLVTQSMFLTNNSFYPLIEQHKKRFPRSSERLTKVVVKLTHEIEMGHLFKVLPFGR